MSTIIKFNFVTKGQFLESLAQLQRPYKFFKNK